MSYQQFIKELQDNAETCLNAVDGRHHFALKPSHFIKEAAELDEAQKRGSITQKRYGLSDAEYKMATKIAIEVEQISHRLRFQSCNDPDYHFLMKSAGVPISGEVEPEIEELLDSILEKVEDGEELNPLEEMYAMSDSFQKISSAVIEKRAGIGDWLVRKGVQLGAKPIKEVEKPWFGRLGSYALATVPVVGAGSFVAGRASGAKAKEQEIANEIAEKLREEFNRRQGE